MQQGYGLFQQQTQKLIMTPELRQAITILQYSSLELTEFIHREIVDNPVFDIDEKEFARYDFLYNNNIRHKSNSYSDDDFNIWDTIPTREATLEDTLLEQARFLSLDKERYEILKYLIGSLNDDGYLNIDLAEVAKKFAISTEQIEQELIILQSFEPVGVGARNLRENILIQLNRMDPIDSIAIEIVSDYLKELGERKFVKIAQELRITVNEVQQVFDLIKTLNPKPATEFNTDNLKYIVPDVYVEEVEDKYIVIVNDSVVPRLMINSYYHQYVQSHKDDETAKYIMEKFNSAKWLIKSIDSRKNTIFKVTTAIIEKQERFFKSNILNPLTLKEIAEDVGVHESTVSRTINQKYVQTPLGIFELKFFFSSGISTSDGNSTSSENVKKKLRDLIENEDKRKPLSDQKLTELLNNEGINISRRTVAKYRDELAILPSSSRKRFD